MWNSLFVDPIINLLLLFHFTMGGNGVLAITSLTLLIRLTLVPVSMSQHQIAKRRDAVQGDISEIRERYHEDKVLRIKEENKVYRKAGISPARGCLPLVFQMPVLIALNQSIVSIYASIANLPSDINERVYNWVPSVLGIEMQNIFPLNSEFLWFDLSSPDTEFWLPLLVTLSFLFQQIYRLLLTPSDAKKTRLNWALQAIMPVLIGALSLGYPAGLSVYIIASNVFGVVQMTFFEYIDT